MLPSQFGADLQILLYISYYKIKVIIIIIIFNMLLYQTKKQTNRCYACKTRREENSTKKVSLLFSYLTEKKIKKMKKQRPNPSKETSTNPKLKIQEFNYK